MMKRFENMKLKDGCQVNAELLPFKFHFFFVYAGYAGVIPFMPVIAKELGINATAVGVGFSMIPIFIFVSNPFIGFLADFFRNIKVFLVVFLVVSSASYLSVLSIPVINHELDDIAHVRVSSFKDSEPLLNISRPFQRLCLNALLEKNISCKLEFESKYSQSNKSESIFLTLDNTVNSSNEVNESRRIGDQYWITFLTEEDSLSRIKLQTTALKLLECSPSIEQCYLEEKHSSVFSTYQFWAFITILVIGAITALSVMNLSTVGCCEVLGTRVDEAYGRQRVFGTISWGVVCPLAGILNDALQSSGKTFISGFYLMAIFVTIDIIILFKINIPKTNISSNMCKDIGTIVSSKDILVFTFGVLFVGVFNSVIAMYELWFLEDMGANRSLLGLTVAMQCLVGEVPFLFFSGWFVKKLGHFLCMVAVFAAFGVRLVFYSILQNPWLALPIDVLHGVTFGLYHGAMTSFAKEKAPKGMEATLLGIFAGFYDGLGNGVGSFLGGISLDKFGARSTFLTSGTVSFGCVFIFLASSYVFRRSPKKTVQQVDPSGTECTF